jgi:hypothetical protein
MQLVNRSFVHPTPTWSVLLADLLEIYRLAAPRFQRFEYPDFPLIFSCSTNGVWPVTRFGFMPPGERVMVSGRSSILDNVACLLMCVRGSTQGGRFTLDADGAQRTKDALVLARFEVTL